MPTSHLGVAEREPALAQSRDFLDLDEPPAPKETPSGSQVCLVDYDRPRPARTQYNNNYTHQYQPGLKQARIVEEESPLSRPSVGHMARRRSTNYIDALHNKSKSENAKTDSQKQLSAEHTNSTPIFKPSYTTESTDVNSSYPSAQDASSTEDPARPDYYRSSFSSRGDGRPQLGRKKSSFEYEDFKKDVYDRLNMFDKK